MLTDGGLSIRIHKLSHLPPDLRAIARNIGDIRSGLTCPACEGGRTREQSLSIFRAEPFAVLKCWRDGCGYTARVPLSDGWEDANLSRPDFKPKPYKGDLGPLGRGADWLERYYGILPTTASKYGVKRALHKRALYFPVYGPHFGERGGMLRYFDGTEPKAITYKHTDEPWQAWYVPEAPSGRTVVVEDVLSALRVYQLGHPAVALLGTHLSLAKEQEIEAHSTGAILLALDFDAFEKALRYNQRNHRFVPILLDKDFKDGDDDYIRERLGG